MERAVARGLARKPEEIVPLLGVDEKSAGKGPQNYVTIISNLESGRVEEVTIFDNLNAEQLAGVEAVAMAMSRSYISTTCKKLANGRDKIVFDRFHLMQHVNKEEEAIAAGFHKARNCR